MSLYQAPIAEPGAVPIAAEFLPQPYPYFVGFEGLNLSPEAVADMFYNLRAVRIHGQIRMPNWSRQIRPTSHFQETTVSARWDDGDPPAPQPSVLDSWGAIPSSYSDEALKYVQQMPGAVLDVDVTATIRSDAVDSIGRLDSSKWPWILQPDNNPDSSWFGSTDDWTLTVSVQPFRRFGSALLPGLLCQLHGNTLDKLGWGLYDAASTSQALGTDNTAYRAAYWVVIGWEVVSVRKPDSVWGFENMWRPIYEFAYWGPVPSVSATYGHGMMTRSYLGIQTSTMDESYRYPVMSIQGTTWNGLWSAALSSTSQVFPMGYYTTLPAGSVGFPYGYVVAGAIPTSRLPTFDLVIDLLA